MPDEAISFGRKLKKLAPRDWNELVEGWQAYLPEIDVKGTPPALSVSDLVQFQVELNKVETHNLRELTNPIAGVRESVLHDGIFLLHKAAHVLGSAQVHIREGMCTWSISSAYQAAFFAIKAIMQFLGISIVEYENRTFLLDVWSGPWKMRNAKQRGNRMLIVNTKRIEQRHVWAAFQHLLENTVNTNEVWVGSHVQKLLDFGFTDFARHRNDIHYRTNRWPCNDLHQCIVNPMFGVREFGASNDSCLDNANNDFCLFLAVVMFRMAYKMFAQIACTSKLLKDELELVVTWLAQDHNTLYRNAVQALV